MKRTAYALTLLALVSLLLVPSAMAEKQWPQDAKDVAFAIAAKITGQPGFDNITFAPGTVDNLEGASSAFYAPFDQGSVVLAAYENLGTGTTYDARVKGALNLRDAHDRLVGLQFAAGYTVDGASIRVNECAAATASPPTIMLEVYAVPAELFREQCPAEAASNWDSLYEFAQANAYSPQDDVDDAETYTMLSFVMNRLPTSAEFEAIVGKRKSTRRSKDNLAKLDQEYLDYEGWRVHVFSARFKPSTMRHRFYINYYYTPGAGVPERDRDRIHVARYDSND